MSIEPGPATERFQGQLRAHLIDQRTNWDRYRAAGQWGSDLGDDLPFGAIGSWMKDISTQVGVEVPSAEMCSRYLRNMFHTPPILKETGLRYVVGLLELDADQSHELWKLRLEAIQEHDQRPDKTRIAKLRPQQIEIFHDIVMRFYTNPILTRARVELENHYSDLVDPIVQRYLLDDGYGHGIELDRAAGRVDGRFTDYLNFLEYCLHALKQDVIAEVQLDDLFDYWLNRLFAHDRYAAMRTYLALWDYELLAARYGVTRESAMLSRNCIAVYGTLLRGERAADRMCEASGRSRLLGTGTVAGRIYQVAPDDADASFDDEYPCLIHNLAGDEVSVEIYEILDEELWVSLDRFEQFDPGNDLNEYVRRITHVDTEIPLDAAWTYHYVGAPTIAERHITSGDWRAFRRTTA